MRNFFRRLFRFVHDPRYGLSYSPSPEECRKAWESVAGYSFTRPFSLDDPETGTRQPFIEAYRDLAPPLDWPDFSRQRLVCNSLHVAPLPCFAVGGGLLGPFALLAGFSRGPGAA
jgi:hypothetical protein